MCCGCRSSHPGPVMGTGSLYAQVAPMWLKFAVQMHREFQLKAC